MSSIDQQIAELEKEKVRLQNEALESKKLKLFNKLKELEGTVRCTFYKRKKSNNFSATWYKEVVMKDGRIYVPREYISGMLLDESPKRHQFSHEVITMSSYGCVVEKISEPADHFCHKKEMTVEQFKALSDCQVSFTETMFLMAEDKENIKYLPTNGEHSLTQAIESTSKQLDIPHIFLTEYEAWLLNTSVFLNDLCFLLTPGSMNFAKTLINEQIRKEAQSRSLLAGYGYHHRNDRTDALYALNAKLELAFENIKK